jgi:ribosome biogenesis GTPase
VVGDLVKCSVHHGDAVIETVDARRSLVFRADAQRTQPLAANVDQVAVVLAPRPAVPLEFAWRAQLAAEAAGAGLLVVYNKTDLPEARHCPTLAGLAALGAPVLRLSAQGDPQAARSALLAACTGRQTLFVGLSGMGKSTLLALLTGTEQRTGELTRDGSHGRQTTTVTRWLELAEGGAVVDSPGFQAFGLAHLDRAAISSGMPDLRQFAKQCRFADCRHLAEPDCAVRAAVDEGAIAPARYAFFQEVVAACAHRSL